MVAQLRPQTTRFLSKILFFVIYGFCSVCSYVGHAKDVVSKVMFQPVCHGLSGHNMAEFRNAFHASLTLKESLRVKPKERELDACS